MLLLNHNADIDAHQRNQRTALDLAAHNGCYVRVERSAQLEQRGCDQDVWLSDDEASASGTQLERWGYGNRDDTW